MYCSNCKTIKAETGCYLSGAAARVCLSCFVGEVGSMPLPSNAPEALGGAFADAKRLAQAKKDEMQQNAAQKMNRAGKAFVAGVAGFREWRDEKKNEFREAKEAFWKEMPDEVQEHRNRAKERIDSVVNPAQEKLKQTGDEILDRAGKLLDELF